MSCLQPNPKVDSDLDGEASAVSEIEMWLV